jgi:hypothetical protein
VLSDSGREEPIALVGAANQAVHPVAHWRDWFATVEPMILAAAKDVTLKPLAQLCADGVVRVYTWLSRKQLSGAEIAAAMQDAAELRENFAVLRVAMLVGPMAQAHIRHRATLSATMQAWHAARAQKTAAQWGKLANYAKSLILIGDGYIRDQILDRLVMHVQHIWNLTGRKRETIAAQPKIAPLLPATRRSVKRFEKK